MLGIGSPLYSESAYCALAQVEGEGCTPWILFGDSSQTNCCVHSIKWASIDQDLNLAMPDYINMWAPYTHLLHIGRRR